MTHLAVPQARSIALLLVNGSASGRGQLFNLKDRLPVHDRGRRGRL